jgi:hypothetical protein
MPSNKCIFNERWLTATEYGDWLERGNDNTTAKCAVCAKSFDISNMGEPALRSHAKGSKDQQLMKIKNANSG